MNQFIEIQGIRSIDQDKKSGFIALYYEIKIPNMRISSNPNDRMLIRIKNILTSLIRTY